MAKKQIKDLVAATGLTDTAQFIMDDAGGTTYKLTGAQVSEKVRGDLTATNVNTALGYTPANDASVVKTSGDQTVAGAKTFTGVTSFINAASQIQFGTAADQGFLTATSGSVNLTHGMKWTGADWQARQTTAGRYLFTGGVHAWYINTGLTIGNTFTPTEQARITTTGLGVKTTSPGSALDVAGGGRFTSFSIPPSGSGVEVYFSGGSGFLMAFDRTGSSYLPLVFRGTTVRLESGSTTIATASSTGFDVTQPVKVVNAANQIQVGTAADQGFINATSGTLIQSHGAKISGASWQATRTEAWLAGVSASDYAWWYNSGLTIGNTYAASRLMTLNATGLGIGVTPGAGIDTNKTIRSQGTAVPTSGVGLESCYNTGSGFGLLLAYDRNTSTFKDLSLRGLSVKLEPSGTPRLTATDSKVSVDVPLQLKSYTLATLPSPATAGAGAKAYCTNLTGGAWEVLSNGTNWYNTRTGAIAS